MTEYGIRDTGHGMLFDFAQRERAPGPLAERLGRKGPRSRLAKDRGIVK